MKNKNEDLILAIGVFLFIGYFCLVLSIFDSLGRMNQQIKRTIFQHYGVKLEEK